MSKSKKHGGLGAAMMYAFARGMGERIIGTTISPYSQCSVILEKYGHKKNEIESHKKHCARFEAFMRETAKGHYKRRVSSAKPYAPHVSDDHRVAGVIVSSDAFLHTYEWRRVRMEALKKYGPVCQCCGDTPANGAVMNVDHIKPRKLFPQLALDVNNLQILCSPCNHGKGNWDMTDWRDAAQHQDYDDADTIRFLRSL